MCYTGYPSGAESRVEKGRKIWRGIWKVTGVPLNVSFGFLGFCPSISDSSHTIDAEYYQVCISSPDCS